MSFLGAKLGANDARHQATSGHVQPESPQVNGMQSDIGASSEPQVPLGVFIPRVRLEEGVLLTGTGLTLPQSLSNTYWPLFRQVGPASTLYRTG